MVEKNSKIGALMGLFILIVIGVILAQTIEDRIVYTRNMASITNRSIDISSARTAWNGIDNTTEFTLVSSAQNETLIINEARLGNGTVLTAATDYFIIPTNTGIGFNNGTYFVIYESVTLGNTTLIDYTFEPEEYVDDPTTRMLFGLIGLLYILGLVVYVYFVVYKNFIEDMGF